MKEWRHSLGGYNLPW